MKHMWHLLCDDGQLKVFYLWTTHRRQPRRDLIHSWMQSNGMGLAWVTDGVDCLKDDSNIESNWNLKCKRLKSYNLPQNWSKSNGKFKIIDVYIV